VMLFLVLVFLLPTTYAQPQPSIRRSQRSLSLLQWDVTYFVSVLLGMVILLSFPLPYIVLPQAIRPLGNFLDNIAGSLIAFTPLLTLVIALSPLRACQLNKLLRARRRRYFASLRANPRTRYQERVLRRYRRARESSRRIMRTRQPGELMAATFSPFIFYVAYVAAFFLISAFALGVARSTMADYAVVAGSDPLQLVLAAYPDLVITTCYREGTHAYAPGYVVRRLDKGSVRITIRNQSLLSPNIPRMPDPKLKC